MITLKFMDIHYSVTHRFYLNYKLKIFVGASSQISTTLVQHQYFYLSILRETQFFFLIISGQEMDTLELLRSFGSDLGKIAKAMGYDIQTLNNMDKNVLRQLLTSPSSSSQQSSHCFVFRFRNSTSGSSRLILLSFSHVHIRSVLILSCLAHSP